MFEKISKVYNCLQDDESRWIFKNRLLYLATGETFYLHQMNRFRYKEHYDIFVQKCKESRKLILFGAGGYCISAIHACTEIAETAVDYICDRNEQLWGKQLENIEIISPDELINKHKDATVIISAVYANEEIRKYLEIYFPSDRIFSLGMNLSITTIDQQYFDKDIIQFDPDGEVFIDGGSYDLQTSLILSEKTKIKKIYAFEADHRNIEKVRNASKQKPELSIEVYPFGLWDKEDELVFEDSGEMDSKILCEPMKSGRNTIKTVALDEVVHDPVTFIKMDIEGAELNALKGAKRIIQKDRPKLAICIYHKPEDTIEIPYYIHQSVPEYKFYLNP